MTDFTDLPDLAVETLGGAVLHANDEFFADKENLLKPHTPEWREHAYTERGKWMDGWETRRRREPGHDFCIVRLGLPGMVRGIVVDTAYFRGNFPAECAVDGCAIPEVLDVDRALDPATEWTALVPRSALRGDTKNAFPVTAAVRVTHVRLSIFPDGGVARLRVHGEVVPDWPRIAREGGLLDLAALENGARALVCSDMFFGSRHNLILPGRPADMSGGWETRRRRGPGHDWNVVQLGAPGTVRRIEVDTAHFKGNAPARVSVEACDAPLASVEALVANQVAWRTLLPLSRAQPHTRHVFEEELRCVGRVTHLRLNVFPDGGVARLRAFGEPELPDPARPALDRLNALPRDQAVAQLRVFCASSRWAQRMADLRPFEDGPALLRQAERAFWQLSEADWMEAFAAHPRIGERISPHDHEAQAHSQAEQAGIAAASARTAQAIADGNRAYEAKFGFLYLVCASGRSGDELLGLLEARLTRPRDEEVRTAAEEQAKILRLRIRRWLTA